MELKPCRSGARWPWNHAFNQTRMELKPETLSSQSTNLKLLIRPEWNWNRGIYIFINIARTTFNQTRMELKPNWCSSPGSIKLTFNQTRMELKQGITTGPCSRSIAFNQTRMELKLLHCLLIIIKSIPF